MYAIGCILEESIYFFTKNIFVGLSLFRNYLQKNTTEFLKNQKYPRDVFAKMYKKFNLNVLRF